ncbi:AAA-ATPase [Amycolatopsis camponoti]|uniref:AAA-ATPase n=1 Tax=Amycolatopsis camponoti TaxID=2606593 RepID=A0A6I8LWN9_9PSEU|nr:AAA-ATPase [Amycolatopsis camponoti]
MFEDVWAAATAGSRQVVFVGGEPGAGKSRLLVEVATTLYQHGATVLAGTCIADLGLPYQPFTEPIEAILSALASQEVPGGAGELQLAERLMALTGRGDRSVTKQPEHHRELYDAALDAFRAVAAAGPLVLTLDDLHWAGEPALQLVAYLVERTADCPILLLATHRTTDTDRAPSFAKTITPLYRLSGVRRLDLAPLTVDDIANYLVREADVPTRQARQLAVVLREQTGGNPFFLRELWRDLTTRSGSAAVDPANLVAPESVRDTFRIRLDRLAVDARRVLEVAAVLGDTFETAILLAANESGADVVLTALDDAVALGVIEHEGGAAEAFRFPHSLARQAVLDLTSPSRRMLAHARMADVIERRFPAADRRVQRLAHHYAAAQALGLAEKAVHYLSAAARQADRMLAHADAAGLFDRAATLSADATERDDLRLAAARSYFLGADFARARELDEHVSTTGEPGARVRAAIGYESAAFRDGRPGHRAVELLTAGLRSMKHDPTDAAYVRALASFGRALSYSGRLDEADSVLDEAVALARALDDDGLLAAVLQANVTAIRVPSLQRRVTFDRATELCDIAKRSHSVYDLGPAALFRGLDAYTLGEPGALSAAKADLRRAASLTGQEHFDYLAECVDYGQHFIAGNFGSAERTCASLREFGVSLGKDTEGSNGLQMYMIRRETGALEKIRSLITGDEDPAERWPPGLLALYTELELTKPTARLLHWLLDDDLPSYHDTSQWPGVLTFMVEAALFLKDEATARRLRPLMAEFAGINLITGEFNALFGSADRYLGSIDSLLGVGTPEECFTSALQLDIRTGAPIHQAQTLAASITHERRRGARTPAQEEIERAQALAERFGLTRVRRLLESPAGSPRPPLPDGLTAREMTVLALVADGLSNRQIADRLVISENTAANHVRSILLKTGSANRTQAAIYAAARGLVT